MFERLLFPCFVLILSLSRLYFLFHCLSVLCPAHQLPCGRNRRGIKPLHSRTMRSIAPWRYTTLSQVTSPSSSTTSTTQRLLQRCSRMNPATKIWSLRTCAMRNSTMRSTEKAISSPLFIQEREQPANLRQAYHSHEESLLPAQSFFAHTKYGETRLRTKFVSKTEIRWRHGKRRNQDSPWKT